MSDKDIHKQCTAAIQGLCLDVRELRAERSRMERQLAAGSKLLEAVQEYAKSGHHARCAVPQIGDLVRGVECTCGYEKLKKILEDTSL